MVERRKHPPLITPPPAQDDEHWATSTVFRRNVRFAKISIGLEAESNSDADLIESTDRQLRLAASVFSNTHDGILITDDQGKVIDVNRALCRTTGFLPSEIIGKTPSVLHSHLHPPHFYEELWRRLKTEGLWRGEIWNRRKNGEIYVELLSISSVKDDTGQTTHFVGIYSDISALKEIQQRLEHLAYYDALTHLPNRVLLADRIQQAFTQVDRYRSKLAVCFLDLDHFKPINDAYGHQIGDRVLVEVSQRLQAAVRNGDTVARMGGDEFALLLTDIRDQKEAREILERLLQSLSAHYDINGFSETLSGSLGFTLYPDDNGDADTLMRHADQAMYIAKLEGRNRIHLFDIENDQRIRNQRESLQRIREAMDAGEFRLFYQPKVDMGAGKIVGLEALIRWKHPERGLLIPADFLLSINDQDLLKEIGNWVMHRAIAQLAEWERAGISTPVSVNISGNHLLSEDFVTRLKELLNAYPNVSPELLELEIIETVALGDMLRVSRIMQSCSELGVRFAIDDFGTGYSSLVYLKKLPATTIKIDQSFIHDMIDDTEDMAIVEGILGLASAFNRNIVAEGVESIEHGSLLQLLGCNIGQGFAISPPLPAENVTNWIHHYQPPHVWTNPHQTAHPVAELPIIAGELEHHHWTNRILEAIQLGLPQVPQRKVSALRNSRFGNWLYNTAESELPDCPVRHEIEPLYIQLNRTGAKIGLRLSKGQVHEAEALLDELSQRSQAYLAALGSLRKGLRNHFKHSN